MYVHMDQCELVCSVEVEKSAAEPEKGGLKRSHCEESQKNNNGARKRVRSLKNAAIGSWEGDVLRMTKIKGSFWRIMGHDRNGISYLYPEEALYLLERKQLIVSNEENDSTAAPDFYQTVMNTLPLACYLTYAKLKVSTLDGFCLINCRALITLFNDTVRMSSVTATMIL